MRYNLQFRSYRRRFSRPVRLGQYPAEYREGVIVRLSDDLGNVGFGEVAPLESFGSESVEKATVFLKEFHGVIRRKSVFEIDPLEFPCTRYAIETAIRNLVYRSHSDDSSVEPSAIPSAGLLQAADLEDFCRTRGFLWEHSVLKLKIGGENCGVETAVNRVLEVVEVCRSSGKQLRLDANEQLTVEEAQQWFEGLEPAADIIQFVEQPIDRWYYLELLELARYSKVAIALDESMQMLNDQLEAPDGLDLFYYVLKPSLGDLRIAERFKLPHDRIIISSVFETAIGFAELLKLEPFGNTPGLDTQGIFSDGLSYPVDANHIWRTLESL